ncbi:M48 family metalloprotease, partial [candidate division KSB1 bacterium]|nr:M48 family metalloprotease [candidate division KSB1 bacterium]
MPDYSVKLIGLSLVALSLVVLIYIGKKVFQSGIEYLSSRLLMLMGIINAFLCLLLFIFQGIVQINHSSISTPGRYFLLFIISLIPIRLLWNYFSVKNKIIHQYNLKSFQNKDMTKTIHEIAKAMDIPAPALSTSDKVKFPFVFGLHSKDAILAIPSTWAKEEKENKIPILIHELAHIRNHDVGFLTWSQTYTKDLRLLLIFLPILFIAMHVFQCEQVIISFLIYLACIIILGFILHHIRKTLELQADLTSGMLVESGIIEQTISTQSTTFANQNYTSTNNLQISWIKSIHRQLADKALFSKHPKFWTILYNIFNYFRTTHPEKAKRSKNVQSIHQKMIHSQISPMNCFWAGMTLGIFGVIIGLLGYWISKPHYAFEDTDCLLLAYTMYGLAAIPAVTFYGLFITLPTFASLNKSKLSTRFLLYLFNRYAIT